MRCNLHVHGALPDPVGETAGEDDTNQLQEGNTESNTYKENFFSIYDKFSRIHPSKRAANRADVNWSQTVPAHGILKKPELPLRLQEMYLG